MFLILWNQNNSKIEWFSNDNSKNNNYIKCYSCCSVSVCVIFEWMKRGNIPCLLILYCEYDVYYYYFILYLTTTITFFWGCRNEECGESLTSNVRVMMRWCPFHELWKLIKFFFFLKKKEEKFLNYFCFLNL